MKISRTHLFPCSPATFLSLLDDPEFEQILARESGSTRELIEFRENADGSIYKHMRVRPKRQLPGIISKFLGKEGLVFEQINETNPTTGLMNWRVEIPALGQRLKVSGTTQILEHADGCQRVLQGEVSVNVRFIGGQIEKYVGEDVGKSLDKTAVALLQFIKSRQT